MLIHWEITTEEKEERAHAIARKIALGKDNEANDNNDFDNGGEDA